MFLTQKALKWTELELSADLQRPYRKAEPHQKTPAAKQTAEVSYIPGSRGSFLLLDDSNDQRGRCRSLRVVSAHVLHRTEPNRARLLQLPVRQQQPARDICWVLCRAKGSDGGSDPALPQLLQQQNRRAANTTTVAFVYVYLKVNNKTTHLYQNIPPPPP